MSDWEKIRKQLAAPFDPYYVAFKAQATNKDKTSALAVPYIDARTVMDRLDQAVGPGGWEDSYRIISAGDGPFIVECELAVNGVTKADVGVADDGIRAPPSKSAYSDALKRAAVKWGIGRYLYRLPKKWVRYDAAKKQLAETPELPAWALPGVKPPADFQEAIEEAAEEKAPQPEAGPELASEEQRQRIRELTAIIAPSATSDVEVDRIIGAQKFEPLDRIEASDAAALIGRMEAAIEKARPKDVPGHWAEDEKAAAAFLKAMQEKHGTSATAVLKVLDAADAANAVSSLRHTALSRKMCEKAVEVAVERRGKKSKAE